MSQSPEAMKVWREAQVAFDEHPEGAFADTDAADVVAASVIEAAIQKARDEERAAVVKIISAELELAIPDDLELFCTIRAAGRRDADKARAVFERLPTADKIRTAAFLSALAEEDGKEL